MKRRDFLKYSSTGLALVAVGTMADWPQFWQSKQAQAAAIPGLGRLHLEMAEVAAEMVDTRLVDMWAFRVTSGVRDNDQSHIEANPYDSPFIPRIPGMILVALPGDRVKLRLSNNINSGGQTKTFAIPGVALIVNGQQVNQVTVTRGDDPIDIDFMAPEPGTYVYLDPNNAPVNRMMGLHGVLVVLPYPVGGNGTPYDNPTQRMQQLFDALGHVDDQGVPTGAFSGHPWDQERNAVWVTNTIDPDKCNQVAANSGMTPAATFLNNILPQYFTLNGKSGFFSAQHGQSLFPQFANPDTNDPNLREERRDIEHSSRLAVNAGTFDAQSNVAIHGYIGQPVVIRCVNAGLMWHSLHIHGNHVHMLSKSSYLVDSRNNQSAAATSTNRFVNNNLFTLDSWTLAPGEIQDMLLPFTEPPDIPPNFWERAAAGTNQEFFPLLYPMHDHNEISNTAAGGNYPHGISTHWEIEGPFDPEQIIVFVDEADLLLRSGRFRLKGRLSSNPTGVTLGVHAGGPDGDLLLADVAVDASGRWECRGRALKVFGGKGYVTLVVHRAGNGDDHDHHRISRTVPLRAR